MVGNTLIELALGRKLVVCVFFKLFDFHVAFIPLVFELFLEKEQ